MSMLLPFPVTRFAHLLDWAVVQDLLDAFRMLIAEDPDRLSLAGSLDACAAALRTMKVGTVTHK